MPPPRRPAAPPRGVRRQHAPRPAPGSPPTRALLPPLRCLCSCWKPSCWRPSCWRRRPRKPLPIELSSSSFPLSCALCCLLVFLAQITLFLSQKPCGEISGYLVICFPRALISALWGDTRAWKTALVHPRRCLHLASALKGPQKTLVPNCRRTAGTGGHIHQGGCHQDRPSAPRQRKSF